MTKEIKRFIQDVNDIKEFKKFKKRVAGFVDGYALNRIWSFHQKYNKVDAIAFLISDDCATVTTTNGDRFRIGEDGKRCYQMTASPVGCIVEFNSSCYLF